MVAIRWCPDPTGRFPERPYYEDGELDKACESIVVEFLKRRHRKIEYPIRTDDLTVMIEEHVRDLDLYADLSHRGEDVQGEIVFSTKGKPAVRIIESLQDPRRENRLRTTLTHEFGHVKFHNYLYGLYPTSEAPCCTEGSMIHAPAYDWMEWQAGYCCGAFLMPARALQRTVRDARRSAGIRGEMVNVTSPEGRFLTAQVVTAFQVSEEAARVRLKQRRYLSD